MIKIFKTFSILISCCLISCSKEIFKNNNEIVFYSSCYLHGLPETKITILKDSSFFYQKSPHYNDQIKGFWRKNKDTLFFFSDRFNETIKDDSLGFGSFKIHNQATDTEKNYDVFLMKSNKLFPMNDDRKIDCFYKR